MLSIRVKLVTGLEKVFENVLAEDTHLSDHIFSVGINQEIDKNGKFVSGTVYRFPLANVLFIEAGDTGTGITVEGEGKAVE